MKKTVLSILSTVAMTLLLVGPTYARWEDDPVTIPEPTTIILLGAGLAGLIGVKLIRNRKK